MLKLTIAGLCLDFHLDQFDCFEALTQRYRYFLSDDPADWTVELQRESPTEDVVEHFHIHEPEPDVFHLTRRDVDVTVRQGKCMGVLQDSDYSFDMLLRGLLNLHAGFSGLLMCHAAILSHDGRAHVFMGRPDAGKTTLSRCAPDSWQVLSDEVAFLQPEGLQAAGSPFLGEIHGPRSREFLPLDRVNEIIGHGSFRRSEQSGLASVPMLLRHTINYGPQTSLSDRFFAAAAGFSERMSVASLCIPRERFWEEYND